MTDRFARTQETLGDPRMVQRLLQVVTGERDPFAYFSFPGTGGVPAERFAGATGPGTTLTMERTPAQIRALRDEGIIGTWSGRLSRR